MDTKILVIDDEDGLRDNIVTLLTEEGYLVESANNGELGIKLAQTFYPDIIICDIVMRGMNGYDVLRTLFQNDKTKGIPFIFLSARIEREHIRLGMELGADDYLLKPYKKEELLFAIETRLKKISFFKEAGNVKKDEVFSNNDKEIYTLDDKLFVKQKDEISFIKIAEIKYITAANQYSLVYLNGGKGVLVHKSMKEWEEKLPAKNFLRVHRSTIICIDQISKIENWFNNSYRVYLSQIPTPILISKRFATKLRFEK
ncbi:MAG: LytTR family DNA-binding domain-containing protein [bacterium]